MSLLGDEASSDTICHGGSVEAHSRVNYGRDCSAGESDIPSEDEKTGKNVTKRHYIVNLSPVPTL